VVTGQSNSSHDWTKLSPALKTILEQTGLFAVDVATSPAKGQDMSSYKPDFDAYDVVVLDYDGNEWAQQTKDNFVEYVKNGGGVVVIHAADNSFPKWKEYNEIIGLGGWGGSNLRSGPMVRYRDGKVVLDFSPGNAGSHGPAIPYQVVNRVDHPITNGLPQKWMHAKDELYSRLRGPAKNLTVLSTAYADQAFKGTGENEPVLFTIDYGNGRIFHNVMGHVNGNFISSVECVGFIITFQRGAEWAATGEVTQRIPVDFPTADKVMSRKHLKVPDIDRILADLADYKYQDSRATPAEVDGFINLYADNTEMLAYLERKFVGFLSSDATLDSKQFICKKLALIGTKASVKTLGKMLPNQETLDMALMALEQIDDPSVDKLLRKTITATSGSIQAGIANTIGKRQDAGAVGVLAKLVNSGDTQVQTAVLTALGKIATSQALGVLEK
ncbi:MAG: ThuA domain-containing protein, partial [Planctomycetes bacterium]|nr:ThuA domain-containing protein [Planctomycetota bacterium]